MNFQWPFVNGIALSEKKVVFCLGSDGAQQEGTDVEAARLAVKLKLNIKLIIDDNSRLQHNFFLSLLRFSFKI